MSFNPDLYKQAPEFVFTYKFRKVVDPLIFFNSKPVQQVSSPKKFNSYIRHTFNV